MKCCPSCGISDFVQSAQLLLFRSWQLWRACLLLMQYSINHLSACNSLGSHTFNYFPGLQNKVVFLLVPSDSCLSHFHFPHPSGSQINMPTLKIQSNPRAICKATAELCLSEIKGVIYSFLKCFFCCCWNIHLIIFSIALSSLLSHSLNSEVEDFFFNSYKIIQHYYSFPHTH